MLGQCDLQKPSCARCLRDNFECEGYERALVFVTHKPVEADGSSTKVPAIWTKPQEVRRPKKVKPMPVIQFRGDLMTVAYQQASFAQFSETYLPKGDFIPRGGQQLLASCKWMDTLLRLATSSSTLRQALCAISFSSQGSYEGDESKIRQGAQHYGAAIVRLNKLLQSDAALTDDSIIPTCQLLSSYEQFNGFSSTKPAAQGRNWQAHSEGMSRILLYRGPGRQASDAAFTIFRQTRVAQLAYYCGLRRACPFHTIEWMQQPWLCHEKDVRDKLFDIVIALPGLLERSDTANLPGNEALRIPLLQDCLLMHQQLVSWLEGARDKLSNDTDIGINPFFMDDADYLMTHGMDIASAAMTYWAISVLLCGTVRVLNIGVPPSHRVNTFNGDALDPRTHATNIVRCMHHFLAAEAGLIGFQNVSFPLGTALLYFAAFNETKTPERDTIVRQLWGPDSVKPYGAMMGAFLTQLQDESSKRWRYKAKIPASVTGYNADRQRSQVWFNGKEHETEQGTSERVSEIQL